MPSNLTYQKDANGVINDFIKNMGSFLEDEIKQKWDMLELFKKIIEKDPDNIVAQSEANILAADIKALIKQTIEIRKDSQFMAPDTQDIIASIEALNLDGPTDRPQITKKKRKNPILIPHHPSREFTFREDLDAHWKQVIAEVRFKAFTHSSSFVGNVKYDQDNQSMEIILNGRTYNFCNVSERLFDSFQGADSKGAFFNREIKTLHDC